jgi:hypothetical protein
MRSVQYDLTGFNRLAQNLDYIARKLWCLVQKQHSMMRFGN